MLLHADTFTRKHFYIQTLLHTDTFTHRHVYTQKLLHTTLFYTAEMLSHTDAFTHRRFYAQMLLQDAFTHRCFYTTLLHTDPFAHRRFNTQKLLHRETLLHIEAFARFHTQTRLHTQKETRIATARGTLVLRFRSTRSDRGTALSAQCTAGLPGIEPGPGGWRSPPYPLSSTGGLLTHRHGDTQVLLHTDTFTHRNFYT